MYSFISILIFVMGCMLGSFYNVCIYRIPNEESVSYPPSRCYNCNTRLKWLDLFPVLSWFFLKGKCRYCKVKISSQYAIIELLTGFLFLILFFKFGLSLNFFKFISLFSVLLVSAIIDYKTQYVFFKVSLVGIVLGVIFLVIEIFLGRSFIDALLTAFIPLGILGTIILLTKKYEGMGTGDLEIFLIIALYTTSKEIIVSIILSIMLGGLVSIMKLLKGERGTHIAFVPHIFLGTLLAVLFSNQILNWYITLFY